MKKFKKTLSILLVFALVFTSMITFTAKTTDAKVKSIKVAKKATVYVGKKKTIKVKVKATGKTSKKFKAKSSNKKIATVKVKKGKIIVTGKKPGKCKITIKSKANKKKKKKIKITVKQPDVTMDVGQYVEGMYTLKFSRAVNINNSNVAVAAKKYKSGKYINNIRIEDLSTTDKKNYTLILDDDDVDISNGNFVRFTVTGVNKKAIVKEIEAYPLVRNKTDKYTYTYDVGDEFDRDYYISGVTGSRFGKVTKVTGLPNGISYSVKNGSIYFKGKFKKSGIFTTNAAMEDEKGTKYNLKIVFVVGDSKKIVVYAPKRIVAVNAAAKQYWDSSSDIYVAGGSGAYTFTVNDRAGIFDSAIYDYGGDYEWYFEAKAAKTYTGKFTVTDASDSTVKTNGTAVVEAKNAVKVTGKVTSVSGKAIPAEVGVQTSTYSEFGLNYYYANCNNNGVYTMYVIPGKYDISAYHNRASSYVYDKNITKALTQNFKLNLYQVTIKSNNKNFPAKRIKDWYDANDRLMGNGEKLFLKPGTYSLKSSGIVVPYNYNAKASFKVTNDMTATATVTTSSMPVYPILSGDTVQIGSSITYFSFTANSTGKYTIESTNNTGDPRARLYDEDGNELASDDDGGSGYNFNMTANLKQGKKYYIGIEDLSGNGNLVKVTMTVG